MKRLLLSFLLLVSVAGFARDTKQCPEQVKVSSGGKVLGEWEFGDTAPRPFNIGAPITVGVLVEKASLEVNRKFAHGGKVEQLFAIKLFDMSAKPIRLLSNTYGPPNSGHGYSAHGPANGVRELGAASIEVDLKRADCSLSK